MAELTKAELKSFIRAELLKDSRNFKRRDFAGNEVPGQLQEAMEDFVDGIAEGIANAMKNWQQKQIVRILPPGVIANLTTGIVAGDSPPGSLPL